MEVLKFIYRWNTGLKRDSFPVTAVYLDEPSGHYENGEISFLLKIWLQTAPLFKPPLLQNSLKLYFILLCAYMTSTGFTMWVPTMTNAYFNGDDRSGQSFCEVASAAAASLNATSAECDNIIQPLTLYAVMSQSGLAALITILLSFVVGPLGKKRSTLMVFVASIFCGVTLLFVRIPVLSIVLFYLFLYVSFILGGMATCLSVVVARGFGFLSVQLIAGLLADHCTPMFCGYIGLVISGFLVALFLPPDTQRNNV